MNLGYYKRMHCRTISVALILAALLWRPTTSHAAWQLAWSDEFNGTSVDTSKWTFETGNNNGWGNGEREYYTSRTNNAYVSGGMLHIIALQESMGGFPYTSARMKTQGLFSRKYGRFEFRAKLPQGLGFWPALWMMGNNISSVGWPACGEIDVMESKGSWSNQVQGTLHYSDASNNHLQQTRMFTLPTSGDSVTNFHIYAVEWATNSIKWTVDSTTVQTWTTWSSSTGPYPAPYNQPFFILMNLAIGGQYLGSPSDAAINANTTFPGEMQVDYVRVYDDVPAPPLAPTGLTIGQGQAKAYLSWDTSTSGATGYNLRRATVSGGPYSVIGTSGTNSYVDTTASSCATYYYVVSATNSLGESSNSSETAVSLGAFAVAVNSGGSAANQFLADTNFTGGTQAAPVSTTIDTTGVIAPAPQAVYQTERYGNFTYTFTNLTPGVTHKVRLHFAETYWTSVGQRRFNVFINGTQVLTNFDIITAAGAANKATVQEFNITPGAGQIAIQYVTVTDNAKSSGIEILLPRTAAPIAANDGPIYETATLNLTASTVPSATYHWTGPNGFTSSTQNPTIPNVTTNAAGLYSVTTTLIGSSCVSTAATTSVTIQSRSSLSFHLSGSTLTLNWPAGPLQSATNVTGPWTDIGSGITSTNITVSQPRQFFRVKLQ